jgi:hypothetical protein
VAVRRPHKLTEDMFFFPLFPPSPSFVIRYLRATIVKNRKTTEAGNFALVRKKHVLFVEAQERRLMIISGSARG